MRFSKFINLAVFSVLLAACNSSGGDADGGDNSGASTNAQVPTPGADMLVLSAEMVFKGSPFWPDGYRACSEHRISKQLIEASVAHGGYTVEEVRQQFLSELNAPLDEGIALILHSMKGTEGQCPQAGVVGSCVCLAPDCTGEDLDTPGSELVPVSYPSDSSVDGSGTISYFYNNFKLADQKAGCEASGGTWSQLPAEELPAEEDAGEVEDNEEDEDPVMEDEDEEEEDNDPEAPPITALTQPRFSPLACPQTQSGAVTCAKCNNGTSVFNFDVTVAGDHGTSFTFGVANGFIRSVNNAGGGAQKLSASLYNSSGTSVARVEISCAADGTDCTADQAVGVTLSPGTYKIVNETYSCNGSGGTTAGALTSIATLSNQ